MSNINVTLNDFNHYYNLANEIPCPTMDTPIYDHDFGHGRFVRFTDNKGNRTFALTVKGKSIAITADVEFFQFILYRPSQKESSFRLFGQDGDSFYNGATLIENDVTSIMTQLTRYI